MGLAACASERRGLLGGCPALSSASACWLPGCTPPADPPASTGGAKGDAGDVQCSSSRGAGSASTPRPSGPGLGAAASDGTSAAFGSCSTAAAARGGLTDPLCGSRWSATACMSLALGAAAGDGDRSLRPDSAPNDTRAAPADTRATTALARLRSPKTPVTRAPIPVLPGGEASAAAGAAASLGSWSAAGLGADTLDCWAGPGLPLRARAPTLAAAPMPGPGLALWARVALLATATAPAVVPDTVSGPDAPAWPRPLAALSTAAALTAGGAGGARAACGVLP